ncbi:septal ring lytic transglycosylase RlpA family protein [Alloacidobacterium dinghuense]|uniref:Probable endolytic peptidoglycan transglycosylase RlpA n=1 Tax=Alloacidobacterium dinghuense TaxID=2763107 RepID=A0A7G8BNC8_9BACT|nr:septal ring lytic transglycosylase RlpA family protein [Alloacidobacterium dinghuense]QNI34048.1 septal ring lytic transglycosylase RlpA family protein [Alloacidobacterium dinghuense]
MNAIATDIKRRIPKLSTYAGLVLAAMLGLFGLQADVPASTHNSQPPTFPDKDFGKNGDAKADAGKKRPWYQIGRASWYGEELQGQQTASGEDYDMNKLTCAHRSLPLGSLIRVTNLRNHKSVVVRVNDRGPMPQSRVIDLSYAAARFLGFSNRGTAPVRLDLVNSKAELAQLNFPLAPAMTKP